MGDSYVIHTPTISSKQSPKKTKKKKRGGSKKKMTTEQTMAFKSVSEWVYLDQASSPAATAASCVVDDFGVQKTLGKGGEKVVFELHSHSKCSDGFLSPSKLVERAHGNGVSSACTFVKQLCLYWSFSWTPKTGSIFIFIFYVSCLGLILYIRLLEKIKLVLVSVYVFGLCIVSFSYVVAFLVQTGSPN